MKTVHTSVAPGALVQTCCVTSLSCTSLFYAVHVCVSVSSVRVCVCVRLWVGTWVSLRFNVVVLNSGPQAPALYRFLFQPGPGWREKSCWLDSSFCCCCCYCCLHLSSQCFHQKPSFFVFCLVLVWLAQPVCYLEVLPFSATFEKDKSSGSLWGLSCKSYVWTSTLAWALISHIDGGSWVSSWTAHIWWYS